MNSITTEIHAGPMEWADPDGDTLVDVGLAARVILYNDEDHTFDEVITQIISATGCSYEHAEGLTYEVHSRGLAMVYEGQMPECLRVSSILEEISLHTNVTF